MKLWERERERERKKKGTNREKRERKSKSFTARLNGLSWERRWATTLCLTSSRLALSSTTMRLSSFEKRYKTQRSCWPWLTVRCPLCRRMQAPRKLRRRFRRLATESMITSNRLDGVTRVTTLWILDAHGLPYVQLNSPFWRVNSKVFLRKDTSGDTRTFQFLIQVK